MPFPIMFPRVRKDLSDFAIFFARRAFVFQLLEASFCYIYIFKSAKKQFRRIPATKKLPNSREYFKVLSVQNLKAI